MKIKKSTIETICGLLLNPILLWIVLLNHLVFFYTIPDMEYMQAYAFFTTLVTIALFLPFALSIKIYFKKQI